MRSSQKPIAEGFLYTDQYQFTMAQLYFRTGLHELTAQFDHYYRSNPDYGIHKAGYTINAGLEWLVDWMQEASITEQDLEMLRAQKSASGKQLFGDDFLAWLRKNGNFEGIDLFSIPEGRVTHPNVPLNVVQGPLAKAQILETPLLNYMNFPTLIATKASRIHDIGRGQMLLEFGLRRAQERASISGVRAALIGGADYSSNVGVSSVLGFPPKGTHAHSMVQVFMALGYGELAAFQAYADIYPDDCLLLVDTIDTLESGVPNAIKVFEGLRRKGHRPVGIRLDSGDLAHLAVKAAKRLDEAGFPDTSIVLSNNIDEMVVWQIITQIKDEADRYGVDPDKLIKRLTYGVGTSLITSVGDPALDGVYKLVAVQKKEGWIPSIKVSESIEKTINPGHKLAWRLYDERGKAIADLLSLEDEDPRQMDIINLHHPSDHTKYRCLKASELSEIELLHEQILEDGKPVYKFPGIAEIRQARQMDIDRLYPGVKRLMNPHTYHVSLSQGLWNLKQELIEKHTEGKDRP
jgi:nicotinate phosphoribosyltransferase